MVMTKSKTLGELNGRWLLLIKIVGVFITSSAIVGVPACAWLSSTVIANGNRIASIEGGQFTASDGAALGAELAGVRERLASVHNEKPAAWLVDRIDRIDDRLERIEQAVLGLRVGD